jgi:CHAT domain-containing protein/tetratricopeptide (TPR) repeat protein
MRFLTGLLTASLVLSGGAFAATVLPDRLKDAVAAWDPAASSEAKNDLEKRFGPFDAATIRKISDYAEELQKAAKFPEALQIFDFCGWYAQRDSDFLEAGICAQLAGEIERLQGKYIDSEKHYRESIALANHPGATQRIPVVLSNLAGIYASQARYSEALDLLDQVDEINRQAGVTNDAPPVQNRAIIYALQGDLARSLEQFLIALRIYEKAGDQRKIALAHFNIGVLQLKQGNYDAAATEIETALRSQEKTGDKSRAAQSLSDLGRVRDFQGRPEEALELMTRGANSTKEIGYRVGYGQALVNIGDFHQSHGALPLAAANYEESLQIFEELHDSYDLGLALRGLGLVALRQGQIPNAARHAARALETARLIGDLQGEWQAEVLSGMAARASGDIAVARTAFNRSIEIIERQRGMVAGGEVEKQRFFEQAVYPYQELALLAATEAKFPALQAAERTRARVLLDMLDSGPDHLERLFTATERTEENRFRASISGLNARISNASATQVAPLVKERDDLWQSYQTFLAGVYVRNPALRDWQGAAPPLSEADLSALVADPATAVIEYLTAREETLVFLVSRGVDPAHPRIEIGRIPLGRAELQKRTARLRSLLESRDPGFRKEARALYALLVGPVNGPALREKKRVLIVPDGPLWEVPFQALVTPSGRYWIQDAAISFAPSLTFLREKAKLPAEPQVFARELAAFGDPTRSDTPPVPGLRDQVRRIAALYDPARTEVRTGLAAGEKSFREIAPGARVVHLAAHGIVDRNNALHSRILLAGTGAGADTNDGWIEAWELMRMGLNADLAVLSACESGRGQVTDGEGLVGLTWALFVSGVKNAVVSQWRVESESASALMVGMHKRVRAGQRPSVALRGSVLEVMKDERYRHPMYWAAFVSVGLDSPLGK